MSLEGAKKVNCWEGAKKDNCLEIGKKNGSEATNVFCLQSGKKLV